MKLTVNGKENEIRSSLSIYEFLREKAINPAAVIVEHNYEVPERERWNEIVLKEGDNLEIIKFMGGG